VIEIAAQPLHAGEYISDGVSQGRLAGQLGEFALQPVFQIIKNGFGFCMA
jgi:hypothetical protein